MKRRVKKVESLMKMPLVGFVVDGGGGEYGNKIVKVFVDDVMKA
jgi:hypothetical protein